MKLGIDLSALQGAHSQRGIGSVLRNFINHLPDATLQENSFVFYVMPYEDIDNNPFTSLKLDHVQYEVRTFGQARKVQRHLPGRLNLLISAINRCLRLWDLRFGDSRLSRHQTHDIDCYFQIDPGMPLPRNRHIKRAVFLHDLIPYVLEWDYLWNYRTARNRGFSRKAASRVQARRMLYRYEYRALIKQANLLLANSECTKNDFVSYFGIEPNRITVTSLGVDPPTTDGAMNAPIAKYDHTAWGYLKRKTVFDTSTPFVLFVGGADRRRKLEDLVTAFNHLRAEGVAIKLVLSGDSMKGPMNIATEEIQAALKNSSYLDDIIFLGYTDEQTLNWLYKNALAYIFPSRYEGFGLPVLEAMAYRCPVICYDNAAAREVAGDTPFYANDSNDIEKLIRSLLSDKSTKNLDARLDKGYRQVQTLNWDTTAIKLIKALLS
ncbi:MAG TPA: glycosyltransferase family 1 protein [Candidatus Saccharimonadales bacterium]|nr:glycosyltransferase family 1 protein [Candidatus Saccharimonadales bacterium]